VAATLTQGAPNAGRRAEDDVNLVAFAQNQRDELRTLDVASSLNAERWGTHKNETLLADEWGVRRLSTLECERLQGFPDGWTDIPGNSDTQRYRQLGNAVAVPVAEWILRRL
jgi:DNA (cytosine-5)-methyltransferase 1